MHGEVSGTLSLQSQAGSAPTPHTPQSCQLSMYNCTHITSAQSVMRSASVTNTLRLPCSAAASPILVPAGQQCYTAIGAPSLLTIQGVCSHAAVPVTTRRWPAVTSMAFALAAGSGLHLLITPNPPQLLNIGIQSTGDHRKKHLHINPAPSGNQTDE